MDELISKDRLSAEEAHNKALVEFRENTFGADCKTVQTGSALGSVEVYEWMKECFGPKMTVFDGYGVTECGGISSNFKIEENVIPFLESVPEMGYLTSDDPPRGLLWVHTPELAMGYLGDAERTRSDFVEKTGDGRVYFNTGDIVSLTKDGIIRVIDRAKNFFKLSQGVFVAPESLEGIFCGSKFVEQVFVFAESSWDCIVCAAVPSEQVLRNALNDHTLSFASLCARPEAEALVLDSLHQVGNVHGVSSFELPRLVCFFFLSFEKKNSQFDYHE